MNRMFGQALEHILERISVTETAVGQRFPIYADPRSGEWVSSRRGSWVAGFWVGQLWLRAQLTGDTVHRDAAESALERMHSGIELDTVTRGLLFWYAAAAGSRLSLSESGAAVAREAAGRLAGTFHVESRILPWGTGFGDPKRPVVGRVDGLAGTVPLLSWAGETATAESFLRTLLVGCRSTSGELIPSMEFAAGQWVPRSEPPRGWLRGVAWLALATADGAQWLDSGFAEIANRIISCTKYSSVLATVATTSWPAQDTSAAAIIAVALCKLGRLTDAAALIEVLIRVHLSGPDHPGRLLRGCYDASRGVATAHELIWGNFFLMLALMILEGEVAPTAL
jgi:unsaturated chondroitin disaccharide hydrolase